SLSYIALALFIQTATGYIASGLTELMDGVGITLYEADFSTEPELKSVMLSFVYSVIVAPVTEELLMRGFVMKNLCRSGQRFGIIMSAFLFGIWHENLAQFLLAFAAGCFFGYITVKHYSLIPSIICHMVVNGFAEMFSICETYGWDLASTVIDMVYMLVVLVGLVALIRLYFVERFPRSTPAQTERGLRITLTSPLMLLVIICHLGAAVMYILQASEVI
ncbi:MAG: CPBP family intramembrane metalloprotease, partial [Oscillospiraceae bacterium]|nr:CPBP family intramembrane metalloprotease [Oscillospiraceae bacterium]